jgi:hypothetical protein
VLIETMHHDGFVRGFVGAPAATVTERGDDVMSDVTSFDSRTGRKVVLFPLDGWDPVEAGVQPGRVVPVDPAEDRSAGFGPGGERAAVDAFAFERRPERLGHRVAAINLKRLINLGLTHGPDGWAIT